MTMGFGVNSECVLIEAHLLARGTVLNYGYGGGGVGEGIERRNGRRGKKGEEHEMRKVKEERGDSERWDGEEERGDSERRDGEERGNSKREW